MLKLSRRVFLGSTAAAFAQNIPAPAWTAIQGVCAWPNLQLLKDGTLIATIFNQPCHGEWEGDLDSWASTDGGVTWTLRGQPGPHEPRTNRMNCAVGQTVRGELVVLVSGWTNREPRGISTPATRGQILKPWVCRSADAGKTWTHTTAFPDPPAVGTGIDNQFVPFGDIHVADDGAMVASVYTRKNNGRNNGVLRSRDDGRTWGDWRELNEIGNETAILHAGGGKWLAASRMFERAGEAHHIELFTSADDARTWRRRGPLTLPGQITGHLTKLGDRSILLTYGNRNRGNYGVDARISEDGGERWGAPFRLADTPQSDCGYPASALMTSGEIATVFYTRVAPGHFYEMRAVKWKV